MENRADLDEVKFSRAKEDYMPIRDEQNADQQQIFDLMDSHQSHEDLG